MKNCIHAGISLSSKEERAELQQPWSFLLGKVNQTLPIFSNAGISWMLSAISCYLCNRETNTGDSILNIEIQLSSLVCYTLTAAVKICSLLTCESFCACLSVASVHYWRKKYILLMLTFTSFFKTFIISLICIWFRGLKTYNLLIFSFYIILNTFTVKGNCILVYVLMIDLIIIKKYLLIYKSKILIFKITASY